MNDNAKEIIVWSKPMCPYCDRTKSLLTQKGMEFQERKIGEGWTKEQLLESVPNVRSVPQIVIDGNIIGGYDQLVEWFKK